jgi:hypothetical protein
LLRTKVRPISELFMNDLDDLPVVLDDDVHVGIEFDPQGMATLKPLGVTLPESSPLPIAAQFSPCAVDRPGLVRGEALHLDGVALRGAADGLP